jgi:cytochrome c oxidase subunit 2
VIALMLALQSVLAAGAAQQQSVLDPSGPQADSVAHLWWTAFWIAAVVYLITIGALLWAAWRARRRARASTLPPANAERVMRRAVSGAVGVTVAILLVFIFFDFSAGKSLRAPQQSNYLTIHLTGHQWWWEVEYADTLPHNRVTTANEIHIPVGEPVRLELSASDVIHSLWVPELAGKRDLVPGYQQTIWLQADTAGVYRGQCAEFCGLQHAHMGIYVIADPPDRFRSWLATQRQPAPAPTDSASVRGLQVFLRAHCPMCHSITGVPAYGRVGPDLTHIASRNTIAAGTLANTRGNLAGWIINPQSIKPGNRMPPGQLEPRDLQALLSYLETLK